MTAGADMAEKRRGSAWQSSHEALPGGELNELHDDPFEEWERYPATEAEENIEYQKVAWYAAPFGDAGVALLVLAAVVNVLRRTGRAVIRLLMR